VGKGKLMRDRFCVILSAICLLIVNISLVPMSAAGTIWQRVGQTGGSCQAIAVRGNTVFAGVGAKLMTLDVTIPSNPLPLGASPPFNDNIQDLAISGDLAYIAVGAAGMGIVNIVDPAHPSNLSTWDSRGYAEGIAVAGTTVFLADGPDGLRILDATDPVQPTEIGSAFPFNYAFGVAVSGRYAYIAAGGAGLLIADVTDPRQPLEVGRYDTPGYAYGISLIGNTAFIADAWGGIQAVNVSNPAQPVLQGVSATPGWALSVAAVGTTLYVADGADGIRLLDVSNSTSMNEIGVYTECDFARRVVAVGNTLYVADTALGVQVINAVNPAQPVKTGGYGEVAEARWAAVAGSYAYVAGGTSGNMSVMDISDPTTPRQVGIFQAAGYASGVMISGNHAFLTTFESTPNYLWVINIADPIHPVQTAVISVASLFPKSGAAREAVLQGNYIYVADEVCLSIFDISVPADIRNVAQLQLNASGQGVLGVAVAGNYAYIADAMAGVRMVDVSIPSSPQLVGTFVTSAYNATVAVSGDRLYAGNNDGTIQVVDVSDPAHPSELGRYRNPGAVNGLTVVGNQLYVSDGGGGIQILDISNPSAVTLSASLDTPGEARQAVLLGNDLYVADGSGGLVIFQKQAGGAGGTTHVCDDRPSASKQANQPWQRISPVSGGSKVFSARLPEPPLVSRVAMAAAAGTCTVTTTADSGTGSLRECLASATAGVTINFSATVFPPGSPATIQLQSLLPTLAAGSITIDGSNAGVILDGNQIILKGIEVTSSYNRIMGLQITNFNGSGLLINSHYNQIGGDRQVGSGPSGQGNVFTGNISGIFIQNASHNTVTGNMIGTDAGGTIAQGNQQGIVLVSGAFHNRIGGLASGERNIISGNTSHGVRLINPPNSWNVIIGNYIGTDITGMMAIPNGSFGVMLETGVTNNTIGGPTPAERNIISGNGQGVALSDSRTMQNAVIGNFIGTNATGTNALPNGDGISVCRPGFNRIGGTRPGEGNLISGNQWSGVSIGCMTARDVVIIGNAIGTDLNGNPTLGNGKGIDFYESVKHNFLGGATSAEGNSIRGNGTGVMLSQAGTKYNSISGNLISNNTSQGIYLHDYATGNYIAKNNVADNNPGILVSQGIFNTLRANAITVNHTAGIQLGDGGNQMLTAPVITSCNRHSVSGTTCRGCLVDIFSDMNDQGAIYEGSVMTDSSGAFTFSMDAALGGPKITATATDSQGNSSGFSAPKVFPSGFPLYFPHVATNSSWQTEIAIINTSDQAVTGTLRGLSNEGQLIETKAVTLSARGRRQIIVSSEFTSHSNIGYIIFDGDSAAVQGYTKFYITGYYRAAIPAVKEVNTSDIYIPHIDSSAYWWTGVSLVNTTSATKQLAIAFNNGQSVSYTLNPNQHTAFTIASLFNNQPQPDIRSAVITNASGIIGLELFGSTGGGNQLDGILLTDKTASTIYYPHVASDGWWTGIAAYNPSVSVCTITITPYSAQGSPLPSSTLSIEGKGKYIGVVAELGLPAQAAWFKIDSTNPLTGFELFGTFDGEQLAAYAGVEGIGAKPGVFAKIEKDGWTGIAFVNREDSAASVTLTAYSDTGSAVATQALTVGGHAKVVNLAEAIFSQDISSATYIAYSSDRDVVGFQLNGSADGKMLDGLPGLGGTN
jgi:parallel beta-helix repeat protein